MELMFTILCRLCLGLGIMTAGAACTSTDKSATEDLDVTMRPEASSDTVAAPGAKISPTAVTDWQAFFKAPPSQRERSILEKRLDAWQDTESPRQLLEKGRMEVATGRLGAAEATFRKALRLAENDGEVQLELASLYLRKKDLISAFELMSQVRETINTDDSIGQSFILRYRYTLALAYLARGDRDKGHKVLSDLIGVEKTFAPAYASLAGSYLEIGKDSVAEFVVRRGLDRIKDHAALLNLMGVVAKRARQYDVARGWFDKALAADPNFAPALVNRGMVHLANLEYGAAEEDLLAAIARDPQNADALVCLGIVQRRQGNLGVARASLSKAVDIAPENAYARFNLGLLLAEDLKRPNEAMRLFHEVTQTATADADLKAIARGKLQDLKEVGETL